MAKLQAANGLDKELPGASINNGAGAKRSC
jgi:hypothetical protein